ncbi:hypothetical protein AAMO2058_000290900 [Amorphochlora amoebiformis]|eukprot:224030-Amorphochlora_amoeboformis.AAC.1
MKVASQPIILSDLKNLSTPMETPPVVIVDDDTDLKDFQPSDSPRLFGGRRGCQSPVPTRRFDYSVQRRQLLTVSYPSPTTKAYPNFLLHDNVLNAGHDCEGDSVGLGVTPRSTEYFAMAHTRLPRLEHDGRPEVDESNKSILAWTEPNTPRGEEVADDGAGILERSFSSLEDEGEKDEKGASPIDVHTGKATGNTQRSRRNSVVRRMSGWFRSTSTKKETQTTKRLDSQILDRSKSLFWLEHAEGTYNRSAVSV